MGKYQCSLKGCLALLCIMYSFFSCAASPSAMAPEFSMERQSSEGEERMIAYTVVLELTVKDPADTRDILVEYIKNHQGYIVRETENNIAARIPAEYMDDYLAATKTLGRIDRERRTGTDITDQYRDNVIRLDSLRNIRDRYLAILARANTVSEIISIERELERINTEIELLQGRIRHAEQSASYASITVRYSERTRPGPVGWVFYGLFHGIKWLFVW